MRLINNTIFDVYSNYPKSHSFMTKSLAGIVIIYTALSIPCFAVDTPPNMTATELSNLEQAKADTLLLDRQLSDLENRLLYPARTILVFGLSAKTTKKISTLNYALDNSPFKQMTLNNSQILSLQQGGMVTLFDDNLGRGVHQLSINFVETTTGQVYNQAFVFAKRIPKNIIGLKLQDRPPPGSKPIKLQEWALND